MKEQTVILITAVILTIFGGALIFGCGYLAGVFLEWICGDTVANGLNMVLGNITQYDFTSNDIPLFCATLTTIGSFFKPSTFTQKTNQDSD